jgi:hypothetical protein
MGGAVGIPVGLRQQEVDHLLPICLFRANNFSTQTIFSAVN